MRFLRKLGQLIQRLFSSFATPRPQTSPLRTFGIQSRQTFTVMATQLFTRGTFRQWKNPWVKPLPIMEVINPAPTSSHEHKRRRIDLQYEPSWPLLLGNSSSCQVTIRSAQVSRSHVRIDRKGDQYILSSPKVTTNGTYKGFSWGRWRRIDNEPGSYPLRHGDAFVLGQLGHPDTVILRFWDPPALPVRVVLAVRRLVVAVLCTFMAIVLGLGLVLAITWSQIPGENLPEFVDAPLYFYANDRQTPLTGENLVSEPMYLKSLADFPELLPKAVLASEDSRYYWHPGVDPFSIIRAVLFNTFFKLQGNDYREGGSTLTQQLARTVYSDWVGREVSLGRKLREAAVAIKLNFSHSKEDILRVYLNTVFLGRANNGFGEAAQDYFKKSVQELKLDEIVTLVAMLPGPNGFDLCGRESAEGLDALRGYRNRVLERMQDQGMVDRSLSRLIALNNLFDRSLCGGSASSDPLIPRIYDSLLYKELYNDVQLNAEEVNLGNLIIETTLDPKAQKLAQSLVNQTVTDLGGQGVGEGALVTLDSRTGAIRALVSSREPQVGTEVTVTLETVNPETKEKEQKQEKDIVFYDYAIEDIPPGSTFKLFAYGAALEKGVSPDKIYSCAPFEWAGESFPPPPNGWPDNPCHYLDSLDMKTAMAFSDNLVALKVAQDAGLNNMVKLAERLGIRSSLDPVPRLVLGQSPVKLLDMTNAFGTISNQGKRNRPHLISRIIDISDPTCRENLKQYDTNPACRVIYAYEGDDRSGLKPDFEFNRSVVRPEVAQTLTDLMAGVTNDGGTANVVNISGAVGKTGTSDGARDLWFVGYVPGNLVTGIWLGNKAGFRDPTEAKSSDAAVFWQRYMEALGYPSGNQ